MENKRYAAYGSNLNLRQMRHRCPGAKLCGIGTLHGYELQFRGQHDNAFATVTPKAGASVPVAIWEIDRLNEGALDRYEGFPSHYFKEYLPIQFGGKTVPAMLYRMNLRAEFGLPAPYYYATVQEGYCNCGLDVSVLEQALQNSAVQYFAAQCRAVQTLWDEVAPEENAAIAQEEAAPFEFSEGMQL